MTVPIPLPDLVGAKHMMCSGPLWVMSRPARAAGGTPWLACRSGKPARRWSGRETDTITAQHPGLLSGCRSASPPQATADPCAVLVAAAAERGTSNTSMRGPQVPQTESQPMILTVRKIAGA